MPYGWMNLLPLLDAAPIQARTWSVNPALTPWLLVPGAVLAVVAIYYLYTAQQRIASRAIVNTLTLIRALLVLLVFALLLGPVLQWSHARHSSGTLWVLADGSLSMRQKDPQASPIERLRWADALGLLPSDLHPGRLDVQVARLAALRDDAEHLKDQSALLSNDEKGARALDELAGHAKDWSARLTEVAAAVERDPAGPSGRADVAQDLRKAAGLAGQAVRQLRAGKPEDAAAAWPAQALHDAISSAITRLQPLANDADRRFLDDHANDPRVRQAIAKVADLTRADLAIDALTGRSARDLQSLADAMARQDVRVVRFGDRTQLVNPEKRELDHALRTALAPAGQNTDIAAALRFVGDQLGEDASVLVVSDGRQNVGANPEESAQFLAARGARVFTLTIGSRQTAHDAAVDHVDAPDWVYVQDDVVVSPVIRLDGLKDREVTVEFKRGGQVLDTRKLKARGDADKVRLRFTDRPPREGLYAYEVAVQPVPDEAVIDNNRQSVRVSVKKDKLNVLLVEDEPRWEYQFLRNYLVRDHRVSLQTVLLEPGRIADVQPPAGIKASPANVKDDAHPRIDATVLPATRAEWSGFDIVILGDVPPERLPPEQQRSLTAALRDGGVKGLLAIAGPRNMPMRYAGAPLADVLPIELGGAAWTPQELADQLHHGFQPAPAPEGLGSVLAQFSEDPGLNAQLWESAPVWFWHGEQTQARPGASVIWSIDDPSAARARGAAAAAAAAARPGPAPDAAEEVEGIRRRALLATINVGLGRVMYLASPETWRLRYVQTPGADSHIEDLHRRFWGQVVRWAVGSDLPAGGRFVKFGTNRPTYIGGEPIVVTARVLREDFQPLQGQAFKIVATRKGEAASAHPIGEAAMVEAATEGPGIYRGTMTLPAGSYELSVSGGGEPQRLLATDGSVDPAQKTLQVDVQSDATVEDRDVNADPQRMASIARAGGGVALDGPYFDVLAAHLPVVDHTETQITQAGLFSSPTDPRTHWAHWAFFGLFVVLITAEWLLRKRGGLV